MYPSNLSRSEFVRSFGRSKVLQDAVALTDNFVVFAPLVQVGGAVSEEILCDLSVGEIHAVIDIGRSASGQSVKSFVGRHRSRCVPVTDGLCLIRDMAAAPHIYASIYRALVKTESMLNSSSK